MDTGQNRDYQSEKDKYLIRCFLAILFILAISVNIKGAMTGKWAMVSFLPFFAGLSAFLFQALIHKKPVIELYSKSYPYRRLKLYGWISAFVLFEFVLVWGIYTGQISLRGEDLIVINILFAGAIVYYHLFVRMKISLRFLLIGIFLPIAATGLTLGLGSYLGVLKFYLPAGRIGSLVFLNSIYWIVLSMFFQAICEEPAFRGYLMQKLLYRGELKAVIISSLCYALWRASFGIFAGRGLDTIIIVTAGNFITGSIFAILFIKSRNLLPSIICHGIIDGIWKSFFAMENYPGIRQYMEFSSSWSSTQLAILWYLCLLAGLLLISFIPRKKLNTV